uniref:Uncharacterized protein n=1 Tax=Nelumbo nucifera TaxID=4432 RepID=A0A822Y9E2_NELNU|nr:TPA_asm: hypothetical protein HUJ06_029649 [Nelumbo nucifera]
MNNLWSGQSFLMSLKTLAQVLKQCEVESTTGIRRNVIKDIEKEQKDQVEDGNQKLSDIKQQKMMENRTNK